MKKTLLAIACVAGLSCSAMAGTVLVGGHSGLVNKVSLPGGNPQFFGTCGGPIDSMHVLNGVVYLGTNSGWVYRISLANGQVLGSYQVSVSCSALASYQGNLLIADVSGQIVTVNPATGAFIRTFSAPNEVHSMVMHGDDLLVGGPAGVWQGNPTSGGFNYAACGCIGQLEGLAMMGNHLWGVDVNGSLIKFDINNGALLLGHWTGIPATGLATDNGKLLMTTEDRRVLTINPDTGAIEAQQQFQIDVRAIVLESSPQCAPDLTASNLPGTFGYGQPNGVLNSSDFFYFLSAYSAGNTAVADVTTFAVPGSAGHGAPNGIINNDDFFYYLTAYAAGC